MATPDPTTAEPRRPSLLLPRAVWIAVTAVAIIGVAVWLRPAASRVHEAPPGESIPERAEHPSPIQPQESILSGGTPDTAEEAEAPTATTALELQIQQNIRTADCPWGKGGASCAFAALFKELGSDGTRKLQQHSDDSIAIQAAWQEVEETVPVEQPEGVVRPDASKLKWFLRFLEQRAGIAAPRWWADGLLDARANRRRNIYFGKPHDDLYHDSGLGHVRSPLDTTLRQERGNLLVCVGNECAAVEGDILETANTLDGMVESGCVSARVGKERCYVAVHNERGYPFTFYCFDRGTGTLRWKVRVWGSWWGSSTGFGKGFVTVRERKDRVVIFGESAHFYVEAFRSSDGRNIFRFSNQYLRTEPALYR